MDNHSSTSSSWLDQSLLQLQQAGYHRGRARQAILTLFDNQKCALTATQIESELHQQGAQGSRASIYRIVEQLVGLGIIQKVDVSEDVTYFEPLGKDHHHHLLCDSCGRIEPFFDDRLEQALSGLNNRAKLHVNSHEVILHGECYSCAPS